MDKEKKIKLESRRTTRCHLFNILFQLEFLTQDTIFDRLENYYDVLKSEEKQELENNSNYVSYLINKDTIKNQLEGIVKNLEIIDEKIKKYSIGWEKDRIPKTDLAILRLSIYEILFDEDIPTKVAINEAIEISKIYSEQKSPKFINGILGNLIN